MVITLPAHADQAASVSYILHERAAQFDGAGVGELSIKSFFGGQATYTVGRGRYAVDDRAYLLLNQGQPYAISIESEAPVESFCIFFRAGFAEEVQRSLTATTDQLLLDAVGPSRPALQFFERTYPHDDLLSPTLLRVRQALASNTAEIGWLCEQLHLIMHGLLQIHRNVYREVAALPAARASTREELYRRLHRAREYAAASFGEPVTLDIMAQAADLSPNHLLRTFKQVFGQTPHQYLTSLRLEHARRLLEQTERSVTEICFDVGFESLGAFSWLFRRRVGVSPAEYRRQSR
jgi:AraC family transcriptional regulator